MITRYGKISVSKAHAYVRCSDGYGISPRWREILVFLGQEACYGKGAEELELLFGLPVSQAQIHRLTQHSEVLLEEEQPIEAVAAHEVVYAEVDGSMVFTREAGWQEVKVGRKFRSSHCLAVNPQRGMIHHSSYVAHLGKHTAFEAKMAGLLDGYEALNERLVFLSDGAPWIANWIRAQYPKATAILDIFHAKEYLSEFLQGYFGKQDHKQRFKLWSA